MWPFKKYYYIVWSFGSTHSDKYAELIKGYDAADAFNRIRRRHGLSIHLVACKQVTKDVEVEA